MGQLERPPVAAFDERSFCINEMSIAQQGDLLSHIADCAAQNVRYMEISKNCLLAYLRAGGTLPALRAALDDAGVTPACVNSIESISFNSKRAMRVLREMSEYLFYCCRSIGCDCVEVIGSFKVPAQSDAEIEEETAGALQMLADAAKPYGVRLALEYMGVADSSVRTFAQALAIVRKAGRDNAGLLVDTWHHYAAGSKAEELLEAKSGEVFMAHISDCPAGAPGTIARADSYLPGDGAAPLGAMLKNLDAIGYRGVLSAEIFAPAVRALPTAEYIARTKETTVPLLRALVKG